MSNKNIIMPLVLVLVFIIGGVIFWATRTNDNEVTVVNQSINSTTTINQNINSAVVENINVTTSDTNSASSTTDDTKPIAHWDFEEGVGDSTVDSVTGETAALVGGTTWVEGKVGGAPYFDGVDDRVNLPPTALQTTGGLAQGSVAFWFRYENILDQQSIMPIFYLGKDDLSKPDNMLVVELGHGIIETDSGRNNQKLYVTWIKDDKEPFLCFDSNVNMQPDTWYHLTFVVGPAGNTGYLNGELMADRDYNFGAATDTHFFTSIPSQDQFTLGFGKSHKYVSSEFEYYKGNIDELRIYDRPLTATEIMGLVN